jgi:bacillopeptidase F
MTCSALRAQVIAPGLESSLQSLDPGEEIPVIVTLSDKVQLKLFNDRDKGLRRSKIIKALRRKAALTQGPLKALLERPKGAKHIRSLWIINGLAVTARADLIRELSKFPGIESIRPDETFYAPEVIPEFSGEPEWNLSVIGAPELWDLGHTGEGIVVAAMDTGVDVDHPDLKDRWRGGTNSWYDPNGEHATPYDANGHGTGVMGILVGGTAGGTAIGVAPGAQWIAVKLFDDTGEASESDIHLGLQWFLDPDSNPDTDDVPDIINHSWGFDQNIDECIEAFQGDIEALSAEGIALVFAAGNSGPNPETSISPANYPESFAVGTVDESSVIHVSSSRGPSTCDSDFYPEVVAPGVSVKTSDITLGGNIPLSYTYASGSSFAAPHVAGAMALLLSAFPNVTVSQLELALKQSALDLGESGPDNEYGYGLINIGTAYDSLHNADSVTITQLNYKDAGNKLVVTATSSAQPGVTLTAEVIAGGSVIKAGRMKWKRARGYYMKKFKKVLTQPESVTVTSSGGGSENVSIPYP